MNPQQIAELAREIAVFEPVDFGLLEHDEETAFLKMAEAACKIYSESGSSEVLLATITYLLVENFVLNAQLIGKAV